ncbi:MAG: CcmD family protein [Acidobacteria bacterium]|nr:CcmD family protein [Acidobacteriota bacterium]
MMLRRLVVVFVLVVAGSASRDAACVRAAEAGSWDPAYVVSVLSAQQPAPTQQEEFVPIEELPPQDQLPAAPLLVAAYSFVVLALFAYLVSVARRLGAVQHELERLESELKRSGRR